MKQNPSFFDFAAEVGLTKHIGGMQATDAIKELCHIEPGKYVLDVGCGVGVTPCYLAEKYGCRVMGVDILERMVDRARERVASQKDTALVEVRVADAQDLPFADNTFDAVITESVTAFPTDKAKAVREYVRVTKPGGYVGLNESTWLKYPPTPEMTAWVTQDAGASVQALPVEEWTKLLQKAGLKDLVQRSYRIDLKTESKGLVQRYGCGGALGIFGRMIGLLFKSSEYRQFVKRTKKEGVTPKGLEEYFGYGLYVGRKL